MIAPSIGKRKTNTDQRILDSGGRLDLRTSTKMPLLVQRAWRTIDWCYEAANLCVVRESPTDDHDIQDENDETDDATASAILPGVAVASGSDGRG